MCPNNHIKKEDVLKIVEAGTMAPSGDNCQPWQIFYDNERLYLKNIERKDRSFYNVHSVASYIAFGAMIENMTIMAGSMGYAVSADLFPEKEDPAIVASLTLTQEETTADPLLAYIGKRCVNRKKYHKKNLEQSAKEKLLNAFSPSEGAELHIIEDREGKDKLGRILSMNDRMLFEIRNLHDFLFHHLHWPEKGDKEIREGMSIESLELGSMQSSMFRLLSSWRVIQLLNIAGFSRIVPQQSYQLCRGSAALCLLMMDKDEMQCFVKGGRALQRVWLTAASLGLAFHPMTGITFLIQRLHTAGNQSFSISHQHLLEKLDRQLKEIVPIASEKQVIMAFRIGYADPPSDKSLRLPLDNVFFEGTPL